MSGNETTIIEVFAQLMITRTEPLTEHVVFETYHVVLDHFRRMFFNSEAGTCVYKVPSLLSKNPHRHPFNDAKLFNQNKSWEGETEHYREPVRCSECVVN